MLALSDSFRLQSISESGNPLYMSDSAGGCHKDQTPTVKQTDGSGTLTLSKQSTPSFRRVITWYLFFKILFSWIKYLIYIFFSFIGSCCEYTLCFIFIIFQIYFLRIITCVLVFENFNFLQMVLPALFRMTLFLIGTTAAKATFHLSTRLSVVGI